MGKNFKVGCKGMVATCKNKVLVCADFVVEDVREKAVKISFYGSNKYRGKTFSMWLPKSALVNFDESSHYCELAR